VCDTAPSAVAAAVVLCALLLLGIELTRDAATGAIGHGHTSQWRALHGGPGRSAAVPRLRPAQQRPCEAADRRARRTVLQRPRAPRPQRRAHPLKHKPRPPAARTTEAEAQWEDMRQVWRGTHRPVRESVGRHIPSGVLHLPCKPLHSFSSCRVDMAESSPAMSALNRPTFYESRLHLHSRPC
jgi:hypothetical protein